MPEDLGLIRSSLEVVKGEQGEEFGDMFVLLHTAHFFGFHSISTY